MTFVEYLEKEKEISDLYLFTKYFCSKLYDKYVKVDTGTTHITSDS